MNERTYFFIKMYPSHFFLERVDVSVVCKRWVERHILRERASSSHIFIRDSGGVNAFAPPCKVFKDSSDRLRVPRSTVILYTLSKSDHVALITWSPSGYTPVRPKWSDATSSSCLLIKLWQLAKAHGVTRKKPKIHVMCYISQQKIRHNKIDVNYVVIKMKRSIT